jgi:hypothetical protein
MAAADVDEEHFSDYGTDDESNCSIESFESEVSIPNDPGGSSPKLVPVLLKAYQPIVHVFQATTHTLLEGTIKMSWICIPT